MTDSNNPNRKVGPVALMSGIGPMNFWSYMYASFICIGVMTTMNFTQGYILTEHLHIPSSEQGTVSGILTLLTEVIGVLLIAPFGLLSDRIGRRPVIIFGILTIGLAYGLYPFATSLQELYVYRFLFGIGVPATAAMTATIMNDYPQERSRGKLIGFSAFFNALGIIFVSALVARMPAILRDQGIDPITAGRIAYLSAAFLCGVSALAFRVGLKGGTPASARERLPYATLVRSGFRAGRNPRIALSYAAAFTARSDLVITGLFVSLWALTAGARQGISAADALKTASTAFIVISFSGLLWAPIFGIIMDRVNRVTALAMSLALASIGYGSMAAISSPLEFNLVTYILLGAGMTGAMMASMAVVGQEAHYKERGAVTGMNGLFGALGIIFAATVGGRFFDSWGPWAPFLIISIAQALLLVVALMVRVLWPGDAGHGVYHKQTG